MKTSLLLLVIFSFSCSNEVLENEFAKNNSTQNSQHRAFSLTSNESDFYTLPTSFRKTVNFKMAYDVDDSFSTDDSSKLQTAIDELSKFGGGRILIPAGKYSFNKVSLKKNVHIEVENKAVFRPFNTSGNRALLMFLFTSENKNIPLRNTGIYCSSGRFTVDLTDVTPLGRGFRFCNFRNANGFLVSNVTILDNHTKFSAFVFNGETIDNRAYGPKNGVLKNASTINSDYGYGLIQMQLGRNMLFKNISGEGGVTLRLEPHNKNLRTLDAMHVLDKITARNVRCKDGNAVIMLSPHFMKNGTVDFRNIASTNCGAAVRIDKGFLTKEEKEFGITQIGTFKSNSIIRDVKVIYTEEGAQVKPKHYRFLPCNLRGLTTDNVLSPFPSGDSFEGPSIAGVIYNSNYDIDFNEDHVTQFDGPNNGIEKVIRTAIDCSGE